MWLDHPHVSIRGGFKCAPNPLSVQSLSGNTWALGHLLLCLPHELELQLALPQVLSYAQSGCHDRVLSSQKSKGAISLAASDRDNQCSTWRAAYWTPRAPAALCPTPGI